MPPYCIRKHRQGMHRNSCMKEAILFIIFWKVAISGQLKTGNLRPEPEM